MDSRTGQVAEYLMIIIWYGNDRFMARESLNENI